ncbi:GntR family transcriptional regulator [Uliginosibacterium gangwonense]|uniref:GntR family transcriptional regulator n=1 Tax=Uliginosibacterium gangwonense TaxID=392736 RepID=UPI000360DFF0|nr:GntR family transcriptional regulator [Uliginosibacterium gangwonense]
MTSGFDDAASDGKASGLSRGQQAYQSLREAIEQGQLSPGSRLREQELAERLGFSRTPIREALSRLESEGLASNDSSQGLVVARLDYSTLGELYVMREVLEGTAAGLAAKHASEVELAVLKEIAEKDLLLAGDPQKLTRNNRAFHDMLYRCAHNRYLLKSLNSLQEAMWLMGPTTLMVPGRGQQSIQEHQELIAALVSRDAARAEQIAREHIRSAYRARISMFLPE